MKANSLSLLKTSMNALRENLPESMQSMNLHMLSQSSLDIKYFPSESASLKVDAVKYP